VTFDEANGFLLAAALEFQRKSEIASARAGLQEPLGLTENSLKRVFFASLVDGGVVSASVLQQLDDEVMELRRCVLFGGHFD
jgi:hypothetical protein